MPYWIAAVLGSFGRAGVNIFVMIGAWFLLDSPFKSSRIVRLYLTTLLYMVGITAAVTLLLPPAAGKEEIFRNILHAVIPFSSSALWFVTCYITLLLLAPFLNTLISHLSPKRCTVLAAVLLILFVFLPALLSLVPGFNLYERYIIKSDMVWMGALYLLTGCYKRYGKKLLEFRKTSLALALLLILFAVFANALDCFGGGFLRHPFVIKKFHAFLWPYMFTDLSSPFCVGLAFAVFNFFQSVKFRSSLVNRAAKQVLGVYVIHQVPGFIPVLWGWFRVNTWSPSPVIFAALAIAAVFAVFIGCWLVDFLREKLTAPLLRSKPVTKLAALADGLFQD